LGGRNRSFFLACWGSSLLFGSPVFLILLLIRLGRRQRVAGIGGARDVTAGLFTERIIQGGDHGRLRRRQQRRQVIEDGIEQGVWIPGTAREQTIVGTPIQKLPPGGA